MSEKTSEKISDNVQFEIMRLMQTIGHLRNSMKEFRTIQSTSTGTMLLGYQPKFYQDLRSKYDVDEISISWDSYKPKMIIEAWKCEEDGSLKSVDINLTEAACEELIDAIKKEITYWNKRKKQIHEELTETFKSIKAGDNHKRNARR